MDNYSEFSPIVKDGIPYKRGTAKYYDWLKEQVNYIQNGFTVGGKSITGSYYMYLNFFKLLHIEEEGKIKREFLMSPYLADVKKELYDLIDECENTDEDIVVPKGRDKGLSYDFAAIALRETQFFAHSSACGIFPGGQNKALVKFKEKYDTAWGELLFDLRHVAGLGDNKNYYKYGREITLADGNKEDRGQMSTLTLLQAVGPDVAKSGRYKKMLIDEAGEIDCLTDLITTNYANMRKGSFKYGLTLVAGTTNSFNKGYAQMRDLVYNAKDYGFVSYPIVAQRAYWGFVNYQTGESDVVGAEAHIRAERARLEKRTDHEGKKKFIIHKQNYPLSLKEMFTSTSASPYDADLLAEQIQTVSTTLAIKNRVKRGNLVEKEDGTVEWRESSNGRWQFFLHPDKGLLKPDVGAIDSFRLSDVTQSDSLGAIVIYRPFQGVNKAGNLPVCIYHHRPKEKESFFRDCLLTAKYYNCQMLIERTDEDIFKYFLEKGGIKYIKRKPKIISSPFTKESYTYGVDPNPHNIATAAEYSVSQFASNYQDIVFLDLLDELSKFDYGETNTDLAYAYHWAVLHAMDNVNIPKTTKPVNAKRIKTYAVSDGRGGFRVVNAQPSVVKMP